MGFMSFLSKKVLLISGVVLISLVLITLWMQKTNSFASSSYHAIFLDNGQVYFGLVKNIDQQTISLTNIYYLQSNNLQTTDSSGKNLDNQNVQLALVKLGKELHGPKDSMIINQQHVLFREELKDDSKVLKAIKDYKP